MLFRTVTAQHVTVLGNFPQFPDLHFLFLDGFQKGSKQGLKIVKAQAILLIYISTTPDKSSYHRAQFALNIHKTKV